MDRKLKLNSLPFAKRTRTTKLSQTPLRKIVPNKSVVLADQEKLTQLSASQIAHLIHSRGNYLFRNRGQNFLRALEVEEAVETREPPERQSPSTSKSVIQKSLIDLFKVIMAALRQRELRHFQSYCALSGFVSGSPLPDGCAHYASRLRHIFTLKMRWALD
jgi:hypothetical protein